MGAQEWKWKRSHMIVGILLTVLAVAYANSNAQKHVTVGALKGFFKVNETDDDPNTSTFATLFDAQFSDDFSPLLQNGYVPKSRGHSSSTRRIKQFNSPVKSLANNRKRLRDRARFLVGSLNKHNCFSKVICGLGARPTEAKSDLINDYVYLMNELIIEDEDKSPEVTKPLVKLKSSRPDFKNEEKEEEDYNPILSRITDKELVMEDPAILKFIQLENKKRKKRPPFRFKRNAAESPSDLLINSTITIGNETSPRSARRSPDRPDISARWAAQMNSNRFISKRRLELKNEKDYKKRLNLAVDAGRKLNKRQCQLLFDECPLNDKEIDSLVHGLRRVMSPINVVAIPKSTTVRPSAMAAAMNAMKETAAAAATATQELANTPRSKVEIVLHLNQNGMPSYGGAFQGSNFVPSNGSSTPPPVESTPKPSDGEEQLYDFLSGIVNFNVTEAPMDFDWSKTPVPLRETSFSHKRPAPSLDEIDDYLETQLKVRDRLRETESKLSLFDKEQDPIFDTDDEPMFDTTDKESLTELKDKDYITELLLQQLKDRNREKEKVKETEGDKILDDYLSSLKETLMGLAQMNNATLAVESDLFKSSEENNSKDSEEEDYFPLKALKEKEKNSDEDKRGKDKDSKEDNRGETEIFLNFKRQIAKHRKKGAVTEKPKTVELKEAEPEEEGDEGEGNEEEEYEDDDDDEEDEEENDEILPTKKAPQQQKITLVFAPSGSKFPNEEMTPEEKSKLTTLTEVLLPTSPAPAPLSPKRPVSNVIDKPPVPVSPPVISEFMTLTDFVKNTKIVNISDFHENSPKHPKFHKNNKTHRPSYKNPKRKRPAGRPEFRPPFFPPHPNGQLSPDKPQEDVGESSEEDEDDSEGNGDDDDNDDEDRQPNFEFARPGPPGSPDNQKTRQDEDSHEHGHTETLIGIPYFRKQMETHYVNPHDQDHIMDFFDQKPRHNPDEDSQEQGHTETLIGVPYFRKGMETQYINHDEHDNSPGFFGGFLNMMGVKHNEGHHHHPPPGFEDRRDQGNVEFRDEEADESDEDATPSAERKPETNSTTTDVRKKINQSARISVNVTKQPEKAKQQQDLIKKKTQKPSGAAVVSQTANHSLFIHGDGKIPPEVLEHLQNYASKLGAVLYLHPNEKPVKHDDSPPLKEVTQIHPHDNGETAKGSKRKRKKKRKKKGGSESGKNYDGDKKKEDEKTRQDLPNIGFNPFGGYQYSPTKSQFSLISSTVIPFEPARPPPNPKSKYRVTKWPPDRPPRRPIIINGNDDDQDPDDYEPYTDPRSPNRVGSIGQPIRLFSTTEKLDVTTLKSLVPKPKRKRLSYKTPNKRQRPMVDTLKYANLPEMTTVKSVKVKDDKKLEPTFVRFQAASESNGHKSSEVLKFRPKAKKRKRKPMIIRPPAHQVEGPGLPGPISGHKPMPGAPPTIGMAGLKNLSWRNLLNKYGKSLYDKTVSYGKK